MPQKYHHLVPRTYLSPWVYNKDSLSVRFRGESAFKEKNRDNILGIKQYYSIIAGMPICNESDTDLIFSPLKDKSVLIDGVLTSNTLEFNNRFGSFDNWIIKNKDGSLAKKKDLKNKIENNRVLEIEDNWESKYEGKWNRIRDIINQKVLNTRSKSISSFYKPYLCRMYTAMDWRGIQSNEHFHKGVKQVENIAFGILDFEIPYSDRDLKFIKSPVEYFTHCALLKYYREFFENKGIISYLAKIYQNGTIKFYVADGTLGFFTSDNPAFVDCICDEKQKMGILPISPKILMTIVAIPDTESGRFLIERIDNAMVRKVNGIIQKNCVDLVIRPTNY